MKNSTKKMINVAGCILLSTVVSVGTVTTVAQAQTGARDTVYFTLPPSPEVLASHLFGDAPSQPLTRSISFKKPGVAPVQKNKSVTMPILFHFGKTTITQESRPFLNNVGEMLVAEANANRALVVEGHTDSVGSDLFNQGLSEQRANAIRDYLVNHYGIDPGRLLPVGRGESALYNTVNPRSGENRRVEFLPYVPS